jgi:[ribosomal protein S5]-alanine N-acetyltransferase
MDLQILKSARLRLDPLSIGHADRLFQLYQDPELYRWIFKGPPMDLAEFRDGVQFLEKRLSRDQSEYWLNWVLFERESEEIVGKVEISLHRTTRRALLAYTTFRQHWRKGYAKEACSTVIDHIFRDWQTSKVVIEMDIRNEASIRLAESLGAKRSGYKEKAEFFKNSWSDEYSYEIAPQR